MIHQYCKGEREREGGREDKFLFLKMTYIVILVVILMLHLIHKKLIIKSVE